MRFFVTGATGFVGRALVQELRGHDVQAFHRAGSDVSSLPCRTVEGDLLSVDDLAEAMTGCDGVFHVAGNTSWFRGDRKSVWRANVESTRAVIEAMRRARVRRGVLTSSVSAIGLTGDTRPADETTPWNWPDSFCYPRSKRAAEELWLSQNGGLEMVAVNPATVFGPGDRKMTVGLIFRKLRAGRFPRIRTGGFSAVDVRDAARGHVLAFERGRPGEKYILGGANLENRTAVDLFAREVGVEPPAREIGPGILRFAYGLARVLECAGGRIDVAAAHLWCMTRHVWHSTEKAVRELGFAPRPFAETVRDSVAWYHARGLL